MKKKIKEIHIIRSESWLTDDFQTIHKILEETIEDFIDDEQIINIQMVKDDTGLSRFWIYTKNPPKQINL